MGHRSFALLLGINAQHWLSPLFQVSLETKVKLSGIISKKKNNPRPPAACDQAASSSPTTSFVFSCTVQTEATGDPAVRLLMCSSCRQQGGWILLDIHGGSLPPPGRNRLSSTRVQKRRAPVGLRRGRQVHPSLDLCDEKSEMQVDQTRASPSSSSSSSWPPRGGSEVLQAGDIKGLLLWTVQSFSCCF